MDDQEDDTTTNYNQIRKLATMLAEAGITFFFQELSNGYIITCYGIAVRELGDVNPHIPSDGNGADRLSVEGGGPMFGKDLAPAVAVFQLLEGVHNNSIVQLHKKMLWDQVKPGDAWQYDQLFRGRNK